MHYTSLLALVAVASAVPNVATTSYTGEAPSLSISSPNLTTKWFEGSDYHQMVELWVQNTDKNRYLTASHKLSVSVDSKSVNTVRPGTLKRLAPGQSALVVVGVKNKSGVKPGSACTGTVVAKAGKKKVTKDLSGSCGIGDYEATEDSLARHGTPQWFDDKKYGIFIHWGLYSVPAYGNTGQNENYAEWYWRWQHNINDKTQTYQYHLEHYGKDFNYDDFAANFTGKGFDAKEWVDIFADAGAQYFVPTTSTYRYT
ncbi:hypothetical protein Golomagni_05854 [Golovinomyces magnicellulatus]|nr:hypothetical protein Golomagni_05854 [Golovinomyces magnicellulatus]